VRYCQGKTAVLVAAYGPLPANSRQELIDRAVIEVIFKSASGHHPAEDTERGHILRCALESMVLVNLHPRCKVSVIVQVEHDDGSLLATCLNAANLALVDAGIQCRAMIAAACISVPRDASGTRPESSSGGAVLLDPTYAEEQSSFCVLSFGIIDRPVVEGQPVEGDPCDIVMNETRGVVGSEEAYLSHVSTARQAAAYVQAFFRMSLAKKIEKSRCL
jgi:ribonuclease PH